MTQFITSSELEHLTELQLRAKLYQLAQELEHLDEANYERVQLLTTIQIVQRALIRKQYRGPRL